VVQEKTNLEKAFNLELKALEEKLNLAIEKKDAQTKAEIEDLMNKIATLSDNVKSIASNPYFPSSSNNGFFNNRFGGSNSNIPVDDRDLRTDVNSNLLF
jgi:alkyl hydroperoxide reductase subunit AhpF